MRNRMIKWMMISFTVLLVMTMAGCKKQSNSLDSSQIVIDQGGDAKADTQAVDSPVNPGLNTIEKAKQERAIDKSTIICNGLADMRRDWCFMDVSEISSTAEDGMVLCSHVSTVALQFECYKHLAERFKDSTPCDKINDPVFKKECIGFSGDCSVIEDEQDRQLCEGS